MKQMELTFKALSPIVLSSMSNSTVMTETHDFISGSILRGILAARYMRVNKLWVNAHENEDFRRLFLGNLRFVDALPCAADGERAFVVPFSIKKEKSVEGVEPKLEDLIRLEDGSDGMKSFRGYAVLRKDKLEPISVKKDISLHMSRGSDKERLLGRSVDGNIYNYESVSPGQYFKGYILGDEKDIRDLCDGLSLEGMTLACRAGRSKFTEYGQGVLKFGDIMDVLTPTLNDIENEEIILRLDTPFMKKCTGLSEDIRAGLSVGIGLNVVAEEMNRRTGTEEFSVERVFAEGSTVENYVGIWRMKRPREESISAGSVFALKKTSSWTDSDIMALSNLMYTGIGRRTEEGFGQLRICAKVTGLCKAEKTERDVLKKVSPSVAETAKNILKQRLLEQMRVYAADDVFGALQESLSGKLTGKTHFFGRLESLLGTRDNLEKCRDRFSAILEKNMRERSSFDTNMQNIRVKGATLYDLLYMKRGRMSYAENNWMEDIGGAEKVKELMRVIGMAESDINIDDGEYFYEYWHWFFRYARKRSVTEKKEAETNE